MDDPVPTWPLQLPGSKYWLSKYGRKSNSTFSLSEFGAIPLMAFVVGIAGVIV